MDMAGETSVAIVDGWTRDAVGMRFGAGRKNIAILDSFSDNSPNIGPCLLRRTLEPLTDRWWPPAAAMAHPTNAAALAANMTTATSSASASADPHALPDGQF